MDIYIFMYLCVHAYSFLLRWCMGARARVYKCWCMCGCGCGSGCESGCGVVVGAGVNVGVGGYGCRC